ncbi:MULTISPECIES: PaaI family thioesterase [unclassified Sphingobacterium]|uniref:PaaI family thioesterase n=1 Tax=unclassified Sphingobacterium TaxID=2609468 RepID=UPI0020C36E01|nr:MULTISPECIES: PaaI family thioesterase [unclassified Sphingobacterium]
MQQIERRKLTPEHEQRIRVGIPKQVLMKMYNASAESVAEGYVQIAVPHQESLVRKGGIFYGGVLSALADTAAYFSAASLHDADAYFLTVELKINYLNPAIGEKVFATGEVVKNGKTLNICKSDIYVVTGNERKLACTSLVTLMQTKRK